MSPLISSIVQAASRSYQATTLSEVLKAVSFRSCGKSLVQVENILKKGRNCLLDYLHFHATMYVSVLASTVVVREDSLVALYMRSDGILSPLRWTSLHLHRCMIMQGGLADNFFLFS